MKGRPIKYMSLKSSFRPIQPPGTTIPREEERETPVLHVMKTKSYQSKPSHLLFKVGFLINQCYNKTEMCADPSEDAQPHRAAPASKASASSSTPCH